MQARSLPFSPTSRYAPIRQAVSRLAAGSTPEPGTVVDVGCGTGYYLAGVLDRLPGARGLGLDTSVRALRSAARSHERAAAATWDVFRPFPLADAMVTIDPAKERRLHRAMDPYFEAVDTEQVDCPRKAAPAALSGPAVSSACTAVTAAAWSSPNRASPRPGNESSPPTCFRRSAGLATVGTTGFEPATP